MYCTNDLCQVFESENMALLRYCPFQSTATIWSRLATLLNFLPTITLLERAGLFCCATIACVVWVNMVCIMHKHCRNLTYTFFTQIGKIV